MKVKINEYRGFEIFFDTKLEAFVCLISNYWREKTSYKETKKDIDLYIEVIQKLYLRYFSKFKELKIVGVRNDKKSVVEVEERLKKVKIKRS